MTIDFELLRTACSVLDGLPEERMGMFQVMSRMGLVRTTPPTAYSLSECGAVGCAMGWLAFHPLFLEREVRYLGEGSFFIAGNGGSYVQAACHVFGLDADEAVRLFSHVSISERKGRTDKEVFMHRVQQLLLAYGKPVNPEFAAKYPASRENL